MIGLDISALDQGVSKEYRAHALRGTGRYVYELLNYFRSVNASSDLVAPFDPKDMKGTELVDRFVRLLPAGKMTVQRQLFFPLQLSFAGSQKLDAVHFPTHIDAPSWSLSKYAVTVLDLIPVVLSDLYKADKPGWRFGLARWLELQSIRHASLVLAISENTARDVNRILGVPLDKIVVTPLGVDQSFLKVQPPENETEFRSRLGVPLKRQLILYVGGIDQRKNVRALVKSFELVCQRQREAELRLPILVMAGDIEHDAEYPKLEQLIQESQLEELVFMPGFVEEEDLLQLYANSSVFFFPSLYEGFGLGPLEAMASGVPVVSSGTSSLPEVLGDAAAIIDPHDFEDAAEQICRVLNDAEFAAELRARGRKQAQRFPWSRTGEKTLQGYERLMTGGYAV